MGLRQQRCRPEVPTLLLQPPTHPRWMLNMFQALAALQSLQGASRVFHELDRQVLLPRALAKRPLPSESFCAGTHHPCTKYPQEIDILVKTSRSSDILCAFVSRTRLSWIQTTKGACEQMSLLPSTTRRSKSDCARRARATFLFMKVTGNSTKLLVKAAGDGRGQRDLLTVKHQGIIRKTR
jgi:hypothetical protein